VIPSRVIAAKRDGQTLQENTLEAFLEGYLDGRVQEYQMSAFLMAVNYHGMSAAETDVMVRTMVGSGTSLDFSHLPGPTVDKHSTGGVGDKVSLALAPLVASLGLFVPMMSGRGLGHTTGTLDKLEAIPGFRTAIGLTEFKEILERVGCAMIGQTDEIAPLDRRLYALRDVTGTVPIRPLIAASIMSKKLAEGLKGLVLDVKVGSGAFLPEEDQALDLARTMVGIGEGNGLATVALLTAMDRPLGQAIGNGLETAEAIDCLRGGGPPDLRALVIRLAAEMAALVTRGLHRGEATERATRALDSGAALERFGRLIEAQGGDPIVLENPDLLRTAPETLSVKAEAPGTVVSVLPRPLGEGLMALGGARLHLNQDVDLGVGFEVLVNVGQQVTTGEVLGVVHAREASQLPLGSEIVRSAVVLGEVGGDVVTRKLVSHRIDASGTVAA
jgi:pyrimidine-nucleoside phosphorylase